MIHPITLKIQVQTAPSDLGLNTEKRTAEVTIDLFEVAAYYETGDDIHAFTDTLIIMRGGYDIQVKMPYEEFSKLMDKMDRIK